MTNEQLVSFVNYQIGQKQGWESLGRVIELVNNADKLVDQAHAQVKAYERDIHAMKASLTTLEETLKAKEQSLDQTAAAKRDRLFQEALEEVEQVKARQQALLEEIVALEGRQVASRSDAAALTLQITDLQHQKKVAESELAGVQKRLAEIKASL